MNPIKTFKCYQGREQDRDFATFENQAECIAWLEKQRGHIWVVSNTGSAVRVKLNGQLKRWKRDAERFAQPVKYGLYEYAVFTDHTKFLVPADEVSGNAPTLSGPTDIAPTLGGAR